jgi:hypothetical protein
MRSLKSAAEAPFELLKRSKISDDDPLDSPAVANAKYQSWKIPGPDVSRTERRRGAFCWERAELRRVANRLEVTGDGLSRGQSNGHELNHFTRLHFSLRIVMLGRVFSTRNYRDGEEYYRTFRLSYTCSTAWQLDDDFKLELAFARLCLFDASDGG